MTQQASDISAFSNPIYWDLVAQELNTELAKLSFIDDLYPVCSIGYDDDETYPECYLNSGTKQNLRVLPDSTRSLSFFIVTGDIVEVDELMIGIPMALMLWANLQEVYPDKKYNYSAELWRSVYNVLNKYGAYDISLNTTDPFPEFSQLSKQVGATTMLPYSASRFEFIKNVQACSF